MLVETKVRLTRKDKDDPDKETIEYLPSLVNTNRINSVYPTGIDGILVLNMAGADKLQNIMVKDTMEKFRGK